MNNPPERKFSWCPVCMVHTYHVWNNQDWKCVNEDHEVFLRVRQDPWIEKYRQHQHQPVSVGQEK